MADIDYYKLVEAKKAESGISALQARMDGDRELVELSKYVLEDVNKNKVPNAISVTLNDPGVFATKVESALGDATEQVVVESDDKNLDTAYIEDITKASLSSANSLLVKRGKFPLNPFFDQQMCRRGRGAARILFRIDKKTGALITEITPWDTRFVYYGMGADGFDWMAYETSKSKDEIAAEEWAKKEKFSIEDDEALVLDVWSKGKNLIYVNDIEVSVQPHSYGYVPAVLQTVPMGSMMADKDSLQHQGESIFFLIRDLIPELNRLVSIIQSLNQKELDHALLYKTELGNQGEPPKDLTKPGTYHPMGVNEGVEPVNFGELKRSMYLLHTMIETRIQRASVSNVDLGIMGNQPWSAVALLQIGAGREQVFLPRLGSRGSLNEQIVEMIIDQIIQTGLSSVEIGTRGHKRTFDIGKLKGEYKVSFKYFIKSSEMDAARFSMAAAAGNLISEKAKRRDILQREDPEEDERQLRWEEAELLVPTIKMRRGIKALLEMAERGDKDAEAEAKLLADALGVTEEQLLSGNAEQTPKPEGTEKPTPMAPLFSGGGGGPPTQSTPRESEE